MKTLAVRAAGVVAVLGALLSGCGGGGGGDATSVVSVTISADLALDAGSALTGQIVLDLEAPDGDEPRALVLQTIMVDAAVLDAADLEGLDDFPDELGPGERRRVVLEVSHPLPRGMPPEVAGCGRPTPTRWVSATVLDVAAAEASEGLGGTVAVSVEVAPTREEVAPPVAFRTVWSSPEPALVASAADDDVILTVTSSGVVQHVRVDGTVDEPAQLGILPSRVARGGGVDVIVGTVTTGDPRCPTSVGPDPRVLARIVDGDLAWCAPLDPLFSQVLAVGADGVSWLLEGDGTTGQRIRRVDPDGAALSMAAYDGWLLEIVPAPDGRMAASGLDPRTNGRTLAVLEGDRVVPAPADPSLSPLRHRVDGAVAASVYDGWYELDLDTVTLQRVGSFDPSVDVQGLEVTELDGGDLVSLAAHAPDMLEVAVHHEGSVTWAGPLACWSFVPQALATVGPSRIVAATASVTPTPNGAVTSLFAIDRAP